MTEIIEKIFRCKFCKVQVISRDNHHPVLGKEHGKKCPRRRSCS